MIVRILFWLLVLAAVYCGLGSPVWVPENQSDANETVEKVAKELNAMDAESFVRSSLDANAQSAAVRPIRAQLSGSAQMEFLTVLHGTIGLSDLVKRVHNGKIENEKMRVIAAIFRNTNEVNIHRMRGGANNKVYLSKDGQSEAVYDGNGKLVEDGINDGSYNYFHPHEDALRHFSFDITPWLLFGQSRDDPTTRAERVHAYSADVFDGVTRALEAPRTNGKLADVNLRDSGAAEAVAIFLLAIERGNAEEMIRVVSLQEKKSDGELVQLVRRFETGLRTLTASDKDDTVTPE
jgi:hypothetical protein